MLENIISCCLDLSSSNQIPDANLSCIIIKKCFICISAGLNRHAIPLNLSYNNSAGDRSIFLEKNKYGLDFHTCSFSVCFRNQKKNKYYKYKTE
jgi:hypothetical protein